MSENLEIEFDDYMAGIVSSALGYYIKEIEDGNLDSLGRVVSAMQRMDHVKDAIREERKKCMVAVPDSCRTGERMANEFYNLEPELRPIHMSLDAPEVVPVGSTRRCGEWENDYGGGYFEYGCDFRDRG